MTYNSGVRDHLSKKEKVLKEAEFLISQTKVDVKTQESLAFDKLSSLIKYASSNSDFWRDRLKSATSSSADELKSLLKEIPITTSRELQLISEKMRILPPNIALSNYRIFHTSGTTSQPKEVMKLASFHELLVSSSVVFEWLWHKRDVSLQVAAFRANKADNDKAPKNLSLTYIGNPSNPVVRESTHRTAPQLLDELEKIQPHFLYTNGLMLRLMAIEQLRKPRQLKHLKEVWSVSDLIESTTRSLIKQAFGVRVVDRYSTEEFGLIALQCPVDDHLHIFAPRFVVEVLDENDEEVEIGKPGRAIITSLTSKIQPLLRYEIGDILVLGSKCRGGYTWPIIEKILGRSRQTFKTKEGEEKFATLVGSPLLEIREILDFKLIIFTDTFVIVINYLGTIDSNMNKRVTDAIHDTFKEKRTVRILQSSDPKMFKNWKRKEFEIIDTALKNNLEDVELHKYLLQFDV